MRQPRRRGERSKMDSRTWHPFEIDEDGSQTLVAARSAFEALSIYTPASDTASDVQVMKLTENYARTMGDFETAEGERMSVWEAFNRARLESPNKPVIIGASE